MKKLSVILLTFCLLLPAFGQDILVLRRPKSATGALAEDTKSFVSDGDSDTSVGWTHNGGSGSNRVTFFCFSYFTPVAGEYSSVTYNGVGATRIIRAGHSGGTRFVEVWRLIASATGSNTVAATFSDGTSFFTTGAAVTFTGVHQTTPVGTAVEAEGTSTAPTVTVTTAAGEIVLDCLYPDNDDQVITIGANQTEIYNLTDTADGLAGTGIVISRQNGSDGGVMSHTLDVSEEWVIVAVPVKPA